MREIFRRWRTLLSVVILAAFFFAACLAYSALKAEERLIAVSNTIQLVEKHLRKTGGEWPKSWDSLVSDHSDKGSNRWTVDEIERLQRFVVIRFDADLSSVADTPPADFDFVRPIGPCSDWYRNTQVPQLISTAKELQALRKNAATSE